MKIEQKHVKHKTWLTRVTVGEGKDQKHFGLKKFKNGMYRVYRTFGDSSNLMDFHTREDALAHCAE